MEVNENYNYDENNRKSRFNRNKDLYKTIYDGENYNTSEQVSIEPKEVGIDSIREKHLSREEYQKTKDYKEAISVATVDEEPVIEEEVMEEKVYDINSIIEKAKQNRELDDNGRLKNTSYDILSKLNISNTIIQDTDEIKEQKAETEKEELKTLIDTVTSHEHTKTATLLSDLLPDNDNTIVTEALSETVTTETTIVKEKEEFSNDELKKEKEDSINEEFKEDKIDKSFFTGSYKFTKNDIEGLENINKTVKSNNTIIRILLFLLGVIVTIVVLFIANNYISL
ncbi:MAG: hypothetical protein WCX96_00300 [Bacilli bacterium]